MSEQMDIVERLDGYEDIPDMDQACQGDIREARREITRLRKIEEAAKACVSVWYSDAEVCCMTSPISDLQSALEAKP